MVVVAWSRARSRVRGLVRLAAVLALAAAWPGAARAADTDKVVLRNGDRIMGEVKTLDQGRLEFSTTSMGIIYIEWDKVVTVTSPNFFTVELSDGTREVGTLREVKPGVLGVALGERVFEFDLARVVQIRRLRQTFWSRLDGSINVGASYTQSSGVGQGSLSVNVLTRRQTFEVNTKFDTTVTVQPNEPESSRTAGSAGYWRYLGNRWFVPANARFERNTDLGYKLRSSVGSGIGKYLVQSNRAFMSAIGGLVVTREMPLSGETTSNIEAAFAVNSSYFTYDTPKTSLTLTAALYPSLNVKGRVRFDLDTSVKREIVKDFTVGFTVYDAYDSKPPTEGAKQNDVGVTLNIGWVF